MDQDPLSTLSRSLGLVRSDYSSDETVFAGFSRPVYWGELVSVRPCLLVGGRGTGKTTTLRGLAYGGQSKLIGSDLTKWDTIGAYWRFDSMVVSAFDGRGTSEEDWLRAFSHYVNLKLVELYLGFQQWREQHAPRATPIDEQFIRRTSVSLNVPEASTLSNLRDSVLEGIARLQAALNGPTQKLFSMDFSVLGAPIAILLEGAHSDNMERKLPFTFCLDEFENLMPYQQRVINTLIKHVGDSNYTIKIGVRASQQRNRETLAKGQPLIDPADYTTVDIVGHLQDQNFFVDFAAQVCEKKLEALDPPTIDMATLFPQPSLEEEARLLGGEKLRAQARHLLVNESASESALAYFDRMPLIHACFIHFWARSQSRSLRTVLDEAISKPDAWSTRVGNYAYASLFTYKKGVRGVTKFYAGWATLCQLANGNIRLLLELAYEAIRMHVSAGNQLATPISYEVQTIAAERVGEVTVRELQGQSEIGAQLTRLTLSLGRIFNVMAVEPEGHAPEVNQFRVKAEPSLVASEAEVRSLLNEAVSNGCLVAFTGNKQSRGSAQTKSDDYHLHPIFAAFFRFSFRKKRRMDLSEDELVALSSDGAAHTIKSILTRRNHTSYQQPTLLEVYSGLFDDAN